ncbi:Mce-associated membrane protein [Nocardia transvalensis]|uniref:Mce-associated membrane protein n=1 Tax=Nocardia transvalensis TaxID=37333 RepID=A0A7W9PDB5_9NOCA|nr:hypothetical protein [Nocardia transvalensis]MBB5913821.1 Mce-associated membrane protein [Nocardia transvalensis]
MSDEDAAKDDKKPDDAAKAEEPQTKDEASTDADKTEKLESAAPATAKFDSEPAAPKAESTPPKAADPADSSAEETVKLSTPAAAAATPAPASQPAAASGGRSSLLPVVAAFAAGVLLVAAITAVVVFYLQASDRGDKLDARDEATSAACDFGRQVGTYDAKNFDDYVKRVKDRSTGDWATQFEAASGALKDITTQAQARSGIDEIHCAWENGDDKKATVIMLITQNQSKAATPQPQHLTIGVVATMEKKDGKWLASSFQSPMMNDMGSIPAPGQGAPGQAPAPQPGG